MYTWHVDDENSWRAMISRHRRDDRCDYFEISKIDTISGSWCLIKVTDAFRKLDYFCIILAFVARFGSSAFASESVHPDSHLAYTCRITPNLAEVTRVQLLFSIILPRICGEGRIYIVKCASNGWKKAAVSWMWIRSSRCKVPREREREGWRAGIVKSPAGTFCRAVK